MIQRANRSAATASTVRTTRSNIVNFNIHKHHRYITLSGHVYGVACLMANRAQYDSWPVEVQQAVDLLAKAPAAPETTRDQTEVGTKVGTADKPLPLSKRLKLLKEVGS